jgi:hypothetical protein
MYEVDCTGINKFYETCIVSHPAESYEDAVDLAIRLSIKYWWAIIYGPKTCIFFVRGVVQR